MPSTKAMIVGAVVVLLGCVVFTSLGGNDDDGLAELEKRDALRRQRTGQHTGQPQAVEDPESVFDALARAGKAQRVPESLRVAPDPSGFWFVGKKGSDAGVEIPFPPGQIPKPAPELDPVHDNPGFVGATACKDCHAKTFESFVKTSHYHTSHLATADSIDGSLDAGTNQMKTANPNVHFTMLQRDDKAYQRVNFFDWKFEVPMQIVTGSSKLAQTYLYWHNEELFQANVTYLSSIDSWINSPGYIDGDAAYARPITARCLECHSTYADFREPPNKFTPSSLILGISCERCHGPGRDHVQYHTENPEAKESKFLVVPTDLSRDKEIQVCSQCHTGVSSLKGDPFQFRPGDEVADHYLPVDTENGNSVHTSNQHARLEQSECFAKSEMTCVDCHNPHQFERSDIALFSQRCLKCHESQSCGMSDRLGADLDKNCIDCHMPNRASSHLRLDTAKGSIFPELRDHFIRIDAKATQDFLKLK